MQTYMFMQKENAMLIKVPTRATRLRYAVIFSTERPHIEKFENNSLYRIKGVFCGILCQGKT